MVKESGAGKTTIHRCENAKSQKVIILSLMAIHTVLNSRILELQEKYGVDSVKFDKNVCR